MDDDFPNGTNVTRYDVEAQAFETQVVGPGLHGMVSYDGALWVVLHYDHTLVRLDPDDLQMTRYPLPGKPGEMVVADGQLWEVFFHPAALVRLDPDQLPTAGQDLTGSKRQLGASPDLPGGFIDRTGGAARELRLDRLRLLGDDPGGA